MKGKKNIIVFRDGLFGDTLIALPALIKLRSNYKSHNIIYISFESKNANKIRPKKFLEFSKIIDKFYYIKRIKFFNLINIFKLLYILFKSRNNNDLYIILEHFNSNKTRFLSFFINKDKILNFNGKGITKKPIFIELYNIVDANYNKNKELKIINETQRFFFVPNDKKNKDNTYRIILATSTNQYEKRYPLENYVQIAKKLDKIFNLEFYVIGTKKEITKKEEHYIKHSLKKTQIKLDLSINELFKLMSNANMYLGNDTGPMHLAALADLDLFVLCPHNFQLQYKPISNKFYLFRNKIDFSNYKSTKFPENNCKPYLETNNPDVIFRKIKETISANLK